MKTPAHIVREIERFLLDLTEHSFHSEMSGM